MTNEELVKNPPTIWLQSYDDTTALDQDRMWCEDKVWPDCPDDSEPTKYVRADFFEDLQRRLAEKDEALKEAVTRKELLDNLLQGRDEYIVENGLWSEFVDWIVRRAIVAKHERKKG